MQLKRVAIFGVGLLGGSIGLALRARAAGCRIVGWGHRMESLRQALEIGAVDEITQDALKAADGADLSILCTPVGVFEALLGQIAPAVRDDAIVTDVGSTKRSIVAAAEKLLTRGHFIGSHPMAGSEKRGVEFARTDLFDGARCIITPTPQTSAKTQATVELLWRSLGMSVIVLSPEVHDRLVCDISHLPHAVAAALVAMQTDEALALAGKGFLDSTRIAGGDGALWRDILLDNRDNLELGVRRLRENLDALLALLAAQKKEELSKWLDAAAKRRAELMAAKLKELGE